MRVPFRQGIVSAPNNFLTLLAGNVSISIPPGETLQVAIADGTTDYLITEHKTVLVAWTGPFVNSTDYWLYWDFDVQTGGKIYGVTTIEPTEGPTSPINPANGQMWFDTSSAQMFEWNAISARWHRKVRVIACMLYQGNLFVSTSINSPSFIGTQVGIETECTAGAIVYDSNGYVIKKGNGTFFTTEDVVSTGIGTNTQVKLESVTISAKALEPIAAYTMVRLVDYNQIRPATNLLQDAGIYGIVEQDAEVGEIVNIVREGVVTNIEWDWDTVAGINAPVFVTSAGMLTTIPQPSQAVGLVVSPTSILLTATIVDAVSQVNAVVTINSPVEGIVFNGSTGPTSNMFNVMLTGDLAGIESLSTTGIAHRHSDGVWSASLLDLEADVTNVLQPNHGGTGSTQLAGYVFAPSIPNPPAFTASLTIPGADIAGDIPGRSANVSGVVGVAHGGTGSNNQPDAANAILPPQSALTTDHILTSNGSTVEWVANDAVTSVGVTSASSGLTITNSPVTSSGNINIEFAGIVGSLANLATPGVLSLDTFGNVLPHTIVSPSNTINITNDTGSSSGNIELNLPVVGMADVFAQVTVDVYGRVIGGVSTLDWSSLDNTPATVAGYGIVDAYTKGEVDNHLWNWGSVTYTPTTVAGYGISDAYTKTEVNGLSWDWSRIIATPSTLDGYGITDSVKNAGGVVSLAVGASINKPAAGVSGRLYVDNTNNTFTYDNGGAWIPVGNSGTVTSVVVQSTTDGLAVTNGSVSTSGTIDLSISDDLAAIEQLTTVGFAARTGTNTWVTRTILGAPGDVNVDNGDGGLDDVLISLVDTSAPGTYCKVDVDSKGRVTAGTSSLDWSDIDGTPITMAGYGIVDGLSTSMIGVPLGVASLDATGKIPSSQIPPVAITDTFVANDEAEMLSLAAQTGDVCIRLDESKTYILQGTEPLYLASWQEILSGGGGGGSGVIYVGATSTSSNLTVTGGPIIDTGTLSFGLSGNLLKAASLASTGVIKAGSSAWTAGNIDLYNEVTGTLPIINGGTGTSMLTGYVRGNGSNAMTASLTIPAADVLGNIPGNAENVSGVVEVLHGGTGASSATTALNNLLPPQVPGVFMSNGTTPGWSTTIPGAYISGEIPLATNALNLNGVPASSYVQSTGAGATGTWDISITGDAATLGSHDSTYYTSGAGATGTWDISITGDAATLGSHDSTYYTSGAGATGTWNINVSGTAGNISGIVAIANGGTGATTAPDAINALLPVQNIHAGKSLVTDGVNVSWSSNGYNTVLLQNSALPSRSGLNFSDSFSITDDAGSNVTNVSLGVNLASIANNTWGGANTISIVGTIIDGAWNATVIDVAYGGTGAATQADAANNILPPQATHNGKVLHTDGTNVSWVNEPVGYTGSMGATGYVGSQGVVGYTGSQGTTGYTGSAATVSGSLAGTGYQVFSSGLKIQWGQHTVHRDGSGGNTVTLPSPFTTAYNVQITCGNNTGNTFNATVSTTSVTITPSSIDAGDNAGYLIYWYAIGQ